MKTNHLIIPGFAKAGTTFLFDQLCKSPHYFNIPTRKETNYFANNMGLANFSKFWPESDLGKWYLDASPIYLNGDMHRLENLANTLEKANTKILICLRNPFDQIFSHYLHDLKGLWSRLDLPLRSRNYHLLSDSAQQKYFSLRFRCIKFLVERFGAENIIGMNTSTTYSSSSFSLISEALGISITEYDTRERSNPGGWLPYFIYDDKKDVEFFDGIDTFIVPKGTLLSVNGDRSRLHTNITSQKAIGAIVDSQTWSREIIYDERLFHEVNEDYYNICELLNVEREARKSDHLVAKHPKLSENIKKRLEKA